MKSLDEFTSGAKKLEIGTKELTRHGTGETEGKFIKFVM